MDDIYDQFHYDYTKWVTQGENLRVLQIEKKEICVSKPCSNIKGALLIKSGPDIGHTGSAFTIYEMALCPRLSPTNALHRIRQTSVSSHLVKMPSCHAVWVKLIERDLKYGNHFSTCTFISKKKYFIYSVFETRKLKTWEYG